MCKAEHLTEHTVCTPPGKPRAMCCSALTVWVDLRYTCLLHHSAYARAICLAAFSGSMSPTPVHSPGTAMDEMASSLSALNRATAVSRASIARNALLVWPTREGSSMVG